MTVDPPAWRSRPTPLALTLTLGALTAFAPMSIDMYLPALPAIGRDLGASSAVTELTLASFFAGLGVAQLAYGPLSDRLGRRGPLLAGLALYIVASLGCAAATTVEALIALRFVQAVGGAGGMVTARAVVRDLHSGDAAARLLSLLMLVMGVAPIVAPLGGGVLLEAFGWRAIFLALAAFGLAAGGLAAWLLPETGTPRHATPREVLRGFAALSRHRRFVAYTLLGGFAQAGMFAYIAGSPFVLMELHGVTPRMYAMMFGANALGLIGASQINRRLLLAMSSAQLVRGAGVVLLGAGGLLVVVSMAHVRDVRIVGASLFLFVASLGFVGPNTVALALEEQGARAGAASAALGATQFAIAAVASWAVGALHDGTMRPMAAVMASCALAAQIARRAAR